MFNYKYYYQGSGVWIATKNKVSKTNFFFANEIEKSKMKFPYRISGIHYLGTFNYSDIKNRNYSREVTDEDYVVYGDSEYCCTKIQLAIDYIDPKRESNYSIRVDVVNRIMIIYNSNGAAFVRGSKYI